MGFVGETVQLTATAYDKNGTVIPGVSVDWMSSQPTWVSVVAGLCTFLSPGSAVITATVDGRAYTTTATSAAALTPTLDFAPLVRRSDLAVASTIVSNTGRTGYQDGQPQHLGSSLLGTAPHTPYPKSATEWGFVAPVDGPMSQDYAPDVQFKTSNVLVDGPYENTAARSILPNDATQHLCGLDMRWSSFPSADNQDESTFKRSLGCALKAQTVGDIGKSVRVNLIDQVNNPGGSGWSGSVPVIAYRDVVLTADWQSVAVTFPDAASQAAITSTPQLVVTMVPSSGVIAGYIVAPYMARAWQDEGDTDGSNWLRPLPFHETLGVQSSDIYCNCWSEDCDAPTLYGGAARASTAIAAPDSDRFFGGRTLSQYTLGVGDGITTSGTIRIEDAGDTPPSTTNTPATSAWVHWYVSPASGHTLPLDTDLAAYLIASGTTTVVSDTVQRADNLTSPGSADTGQAWTVLSGTWGVFGNTLQLQTQVAEDAIVIDAGVSDLTHEATLFAVGNDGSLEFRVTDADNRWRLLWEAGTLYLQKNVAGAGFSTVVSSVVALSAGDRVGVVLAGNSISPTHNGTTIAALVTTDAFNATATKHGVGALNNGPRYSLVTDTATTDSAHTYGPVAPVSDATRYGLARGSALVAADGSQFFRCRIPINLASEGYLDFTPRIVSTVPGLVLNGYRAAVTTEGPRGLGLHSAWVPKRTVTGRQFGDSCFEIIPNIAAILDPANMVLGMRQVHPWQPSDLDNLNGAGSSGIFPSFWQSGPYGTASDGGLAADVTHNGDGTFSMTFFAERLTGPAGQLSWTIHINNISAAQASVLWQRFVALDVFVIISSGAPQAIGFGLGTGTGMTWYEHGDAFFGGTVVFESVAGADWAFDVAGFSDPGHMGIAADLDRVRQSGWIQTVFAQNTIPASVAGLKNSLEVQIARVWGARRDHRLAA